MVTKQITIFDVFLSYLDGKTARYSYLSSAMSDEVMDLSLFEYNGSRLP